MKRLSATILILIILITQSGLSIAMHRCGGKITNIELFTSHKHHCPCGKKSMKPGCCKDKITTLKIQNDLLKLHKYSLNDPISKHILSLTFPVEALINIQFESYLADFYHPPPPKLKVRIHQLNQNFLI